MKKEIFKGSKEELLAKVKRRYPIGTVVDCVNGNVRNSIVEDYRRHYTYSRDVFTSDNCWLHLDGQWAKIISTPGSTSKKLYRIC